MSEILVTADNVSKKFCRNLKRSLWYGVKDLGSEIIGLSQNDNGQLRKEEFWAVKEVNFELKRGDFWGLIGRNGAGKTTLLRMLNGLLKPDRGRIEMRGRVGALIALGAGFNPILTGRENIYVNAAVLGLKKNDVDARFDEIVEFAEIADFIDAPVQSYSSGMAVRLGFAVATALEPDILLLDEVLAVGDTRFRSKCFQRIQKIINEGGTILLVTHTLEQVAYFCNGALFMDKGKLLFNGETTEALRYYMDMSTNKPTPAIIDGTPKKVFSGGSEEKFQYNPYYNPYEIRWGDRAATITDVCLIQHCVEHPSSISPGIKVKIILNIYFFSDVSKPIYGLTIKSPKGDILFSINSRQLLGPSGVPPQREGDQLKICFSFTPYLDIGEYLISVGIVSETESGIIPHDRRYDSIKLRVGYPLSSTGDIAMNPSFRVLT